MADGREELKKQILELTAAYYRAAFAETEPFAAGDRINYAGRVFDERELVNLVDSSLEFWLTSGRYTAEFEQKLAAYLGVRHCSLVNSGSSANLLAFMALTAPELGERQIRRGDEVITVAAGFPTTVAPMLQYGAVPVFVDVTIPQYNIDADRLEDALSSRTKAVMLAHTLGNPFDLNAVRAFCDRHGLWLIEDNCDALGSQYRMDGVWGKTGTFGDIGTSSFYPPHHITTGEGGAVYTNDPRLHRILRSLRDWGRDCWCDSGYDDTCGHRFEGQYGELPRGYDHKYVYSHFGYNLKATDLQAAVGCTQLDKLDGFTALRKKHWSYLRERLDEAGDQLILPEPEPNADPSWFGFLLTVRDGAGFSRDELTAHLETHNIQTRNLFAGNLVCHPCFDALRATGTGYRVAGGLQNTDRIMKRSLWIGVYPGMTEDRLAYMAEQILTFLQTHRG